MNILILGENGISRKNWGHQLFLNSFSKHHKVTYWGLYHPNFTWDLSIPQVINKYGKPDIILTYMAKRCYPFRSLADITNIPKVHIEVDFFKREAGGYRGQYDNAGWNRYKDFFASNKFDIMFARETSGHDGLKEAKVAEEVFYLPFSVDIDIYKNLNDKRLIDVMAVFSGNPDAYPRRIPIQKLLTKVAKKHGQFKVTTRKMYHNSYVEQLNRSKIFVTSNNRWGSLSMKYYEVMACETFLLADLPTDLGRVGLQDRTHLVIYNSLTDLLDKINYYLKHPEERETIAKRGMKFVIENHSNDIRVKQFTEIVSKEIFGGKL